MSITTKITLTCSDPLADLQSKFAQPTDRPMEEIQNIVSYLRGMQLGLRDASLDVQVDNGNAAAASATVTLSGINSANDTILINGVTLTAVEGRASGTVAFSDVATANDTVLVNGVTFTAKASGATGNQFNVGANATASAANLATAINASASVNTVLTASAATGTLTVKAMLSGTAGNALTLAEGVDSGSVITVSGATLSGGAAPGSNQWGLAGSSANQATAMAAGINASASALILSHVTAAAAGSVVTVTARNKGISGNTITLAEGVDGGSKMAVSAARLSGGTEATANVYTP